MSGMSERYEIGDPTNGVMDYVASIAEAEAYVHRLSNRDGVIVFDRYAKRDGVDARIWIQGHLTGCHRKSDTARTIAQAAEEMRKQYGAFSCEQEAVHTSTTDLEEEQG